MDGSLSTSQFIFAISQLSIYTFYTQLRAKGWKNLIFANRNIYALFDLGQC
jgi:hypothetical protein